MRTRLPSFSVLHSRFPDPVVTTGGRAFRLGAAFFLAGGGGKFAATFSGSLRFIQDGTSRFAGSRFKVGIAGASGTTIVPSDVREQAASDSIMPPATAIVPILPIPLI
jgi:hypothetical protein